MPDHIYLSPHLDDAIFSCGGVIYQQTSMGEDVLIVTIFAGDPDGSRISPFAQSLHERWGIEGFSVETRRVEDLHACERVGARAHHLLVPESIYRLGVDGTPMYASEETIFGDLDPSEQSLQDTIAKQLEEICSGDVPVYVPSGYGGHVDHVLLRQIASKLDINIYFYRDFPYAIRGEEIAQEDQFYSEEQYRIRLSDLQIRIWAEAVSDYESQLSTFWEDAQRIEGELKSAHGEMGGIPFYST